MGFKYSGAWLDNYLSTGEKAWLSGLACSSLLLLNVSLLLCFRVVPPSECPFVRPFSLTRYLKNALADFVQIWKHDYPRGQDELIKFWSHHDIILANGSLIEYSLTLSVLSLRLSWQLPSARFGRMRPKRAQGSCRPAPFLKYLEPLILD